MVEPIDSVFPGLSQSAYQVTSPATLDYNCIAWAAGETTRWWWPDADEQNDAVYWPTGVPAEESFDAFRAAFAVLGYAPCEDDQLESGWQKVALFAPRMPRDNSRTAAGPAS